MKTPSTKAVKKIPFSEKTYRDLKIKQAKCHQCRERFGELWICKKHSAIISRNHMTLVRWLYWSFVTGIIYIDMKKILQRIFQAVVMVIVSVIILQLLSVGLEKSAVASCIELDRQSREHPNFWITENQDKMCKNVDIHVDAPIR